MLTIRQMLKAARRVYVLLDPDYAPACVNLPTVRISRAAALSLLDKVGKDHEPKGVLDVKGDLYLIPADKKEEAF